VCKELAIVAISASCRVNPYKSSLSICLTITYSLLLSSFYKLAIELAYKGYLAC